MQTLHAQVSTRHSTESFTVCTVHYCWRCYTRYSSEEAFADHYKLCDTHICSRYKSRWSSISHYRGHLKSCRVCRCSSCLSRFQTGEALLKHRKTCAVYKCPGCLDRLFNHDTYRAHRMICLVCIQPRCSRQCSEVSHGLCSHHEQLGKQKASMAAVLLDRSSPYPVSNAIRRTWHAWTNEPMNTVIIDFEFFSPVAYDRVFQIAMANARGEWIVPQTNINHKKPTADLVVVDCRQFRRAGGYWDNADTICNVYGSVNDTLMSGLTWKEISDQIDQYTRVGIQYLSGVWFANPYIAIW